MADTSYKAEIIDPGDLVSRWAKDVNVGSYNNCPAVRVRALQPNNFRGPVAFTWQPALLQGMLRSAMNPDDWDLLEAIETDGAGGKPQFFALMGTPHVFANLGWEIIEMCVEDFARSGRMACIMANNLDIKKITEKNLFLISALFSGFDNALRTAGLVSLTGETAVMKHSVTAFCDTGSDEQLIVNWGGFCVGLTDRRAYLDGSAIRPGDAVVGFWEPGYRCNGGTFFTKLILNKWGPAPMSSDSPYARKFVADLCIPSKHCATTIYRLLGWRRNGLLQRRLAEIKGIAHITGGGVWEKFGELLPEGCGAILDTMPKPADVLLTAQLLSQSTPDKMSDWQAYSTFHGGCGMLIVCNPKHVDRIIGEAVADGITAQKVGDIVESADREVVVFSRFSQQPGRGLSSLHPE